MQRAANAGAVRRAEVPILQASTVLSAYQSAAPGLALVRVLTMSQRAARSPVAWSALAGALQRAACWSSCSTAAHLARSLASDDASGLWIRVPTDTRELATRSALAHALDRAAANNSSLRASPPAQFRAR